MCVYFDVPRSRAAVAQESFFSPHGRCLHYATNDMRAFARERKNRDRERNNELLGGAEKL